MIKSQRDSVLYRYRGWHEIGGGSVVSIDRWDVLAHELSHRFGRLHNPPNRVTSPDCTASNTDPAALPRDSTIGEVGVDVVGALWRLATGGMVQDAIRPATAPNIMDVCSAGGRWVSPYTWLRNLRGLQGGGAFLLTDPAI